jgi:hypothetical protein
LYSTYFNYDNNTNKSNYICIGKKIYINSINTVMKLYLKKKIIPIITIVLVVLLLSYIYFDFVKLKTIENLEEKPTIIGYIHVCEKGEWQKSYDLLIDSVKGYGLYDNTTEIRLGIIYDEDLIMDKRFDDPKIKIIYKGNSKEYERPTLLHMKKSSNSDPPGTLYYYLHTKGIRWFGTKEEDGVVEWIKSMLYWNIQKWKDAVEILKTYETYGCHYNNLHYVGNFWWATKEHILKLSDVIPDYYTAPEDWVLTNKDNMYCSHNCSNDFVLPYSLDMYS